MPFRLLGVDDNRVHARWAPRISKGLGWPCPRDARGGRNSSLVQLLRLLAQVPDFQLECCLRWLACGGPRVLGVVGESFPTSSSEERHICLNGGARLRVQSLRRFVLLCDKAGGVVEAGSIALLQGCERQRQCPIYAHKVQCCFERWYDTIRRCFVAPPNSLPRGFFVDKESAPSFHVIKRCPLRLDGIPSHRYALFMARCVAPAV